VVLFTQLRPQSLIGLPSTLPTSSFRRSQNLRIGPCRCLFCPIPTPKAVILSEGAHSTTVNAAAEGPRHTRRHPNTQSLSAIERSPLLLLLPLLLRSAKASALAHAHTRNRASAPETRVAIARVMIEAESEPLICPHTDTIANAIRTEMGAYSSQIQRRGCY
jgi:hypothetical protein